MAKVDKSGSEGSRPTAKRQKFDLKGKSTVTDDSSANVESERYTKDTQPTVCSSCNLTRFNKTIEATNLRDRHMAVLSRTPFPHLLGIPGACYEKNFLTEMVARWNPQDKCFQIGDKSLPLKPSDVSIILGLSMHGKMVDDEFILSESSTLNDLFGNGAISIAEIEMKLKQLAAKEDETVDNVKVLVLYMFVSVLFPVTSTPSAKRFGLFLDDFDNLMGYAWANAVHRFLVKCLDDVHGRLHSMRQGKKQTKVFLNGCAAVLQAQFYHYSQHMPNEAVENVVDAQEQNGHEQMSSKPPESDVEMPPSNGENEQLPAKHPQNDDDMPMITGENEQSPAKPPQDNANDGPVVSGENALLLSKEKLEEYTQQTVE